MICTCTLVTSKVDGQVYRLVGRTTGGYARPCAGHLRSPEERRARQLQRRHRARGGRHG